MNKPLIHLINEDTLAVEPELICSYESDEEVETHYEWVGFPYKDKDSAQRFRLVVQEQDGQMYWTASISYEYQLMWDGVTMKHARPKSIAGGVFDPAPDHSKPLAGFVEAVISYFRNAYAG